MRRIVILGAAALLATACAGCMTFGPLNPKAGIADASFEEGWGAQGFAYPPEKVRDTAREAMSDMQMHTVHKSRAEPSSLLLDGQAHDGRHVRIVVRPSGVGSLVTVRVGRLGDEALSRAVLERIGVRLGTLPPAAIPEEPPTSPRRSFFSKNAVPDSEMLREQSIAGYRDTISP